MKVGSSGFQPASMFNQLLKKADKTTNNSGDLSNIKFSHTTEIASKVMYQKISDSLSMPKANKEPLFDFEEVAKNVMGFVKGAVLGAKSDGASDDKLQSLLSQARQGIATGIDEASQELDEAGLLTDDIKLGIEKTNELLDEGLDDFEQSLFSPSKSTANYSQANHYSLSNGAEFVIQTQEGDEIKISFNTDYQQLNASAFTSNDQGAAFSGINAQSYSASFSFEVNGNLNEQEQQAINDLMKDLQKVSDDFFTGSIEDAFDQALKINMDPQQLAAFSMNLQQTETLASVQEYQSSLPATAIAKSLEPINQGLQQAYEHAKPLSLAAELGGLMQWLNQETERADQLLAYSNEIFQHLAQLDQQDKTTQKPDNDILS